VVFCAVALVALVVFWRVYSYLLFAHSFWLFIACLIYMFLFVGAPHDMAHRPCLPYPP